MSRVIGIYLLGVALRLLLFPSYKSTDFEVHRNWLAITNSLPVSRWYEDETSEWTLDYPPLFAWFERLLSVFGRFVDKEMLVVTNLNYASPATVAFQRSTVIATELVLVWAVIRATRHMPDSAAHLATALVVFCPALILVDHIHFQYNGMLLGVLVLSVSYILEGRDWVAGIIFSVLVNLKHLYATAGPLYFVYLLRHYCRGFTAVSRFFVLGVSVMAVCAASLGPFIAMGQLKQVLSRLFPFQRGLCHAYWAPNFWALYSALDKAAALITTKLGLMQHAPVASMTGGLVGVSRFVVLPQITPTTTLLLTLIAMLPSLVAVWKKPNPAAVPDAVAYVSCCSFMFGYHVHEKAVLNVIIPAAITALYSGRNAGLFLLLSTCGSYAVFPLLFTYPEYPVKVLLLVAYVVAAFTLMPRHLPDNQRLQITSLELYYMLGFVPLELYCAVLHQLFWGDALPFLPLMLTSIYCAIGMCWIWVCMLANILRSGSKQKLS